MPESWGVVLLVFSLQACHFKMYSCKGDTDGFAEELCRGHKTVLSLHRIAHLNGWCTEMIV